MLCAHYAKKTETILVHFISFELTRILKSRVFTIYMKETMYVSIQTISSLACDRLCAYSALTASAGTWALIPRRVVFAALWCIRTRSAQVVSPNVRAKLSKCQYQVRR